MRKVKTSVLAMLSVVALLFSSCLGDSDYAPSIGCTGKPLGSLSADVKLDNGVIVTLSGISATTLMDIDRMYVYGQLTGEDANLETINPGDKVTITPNFYVTLSKAQSFLEDASWSDLNLSEMESLNWFSPDGYSLVNALNGYMNFMTTGMAYAKKNESSSSSSSDSYTLLTPRYYVKVKRLDTSNKIVDLVLGYDNRSSECLDENGKLKEGYISQKSTFCFYFDTYELYTYLNGIADEDAVTFNIYKVQKNSKGEYEEVKVSMNYASIQKGYLKRTY